MILRKKMEKVKIGYTSSGCPNPSLSIPFDRGAQMTRGNWGGILDHSSSKSFPN